MGWGIFMGLEHGGFDQRCNFNGHDENPVEGFFRSVPTNPHSLCEHIMKWVTSKWDKLFDEHV